MSVPITPQLRAFLTGAVRIGKIGAIRKSGAPWVQPVWFLVDGDEVVFVFSGQSLLSRCVRRDNRVTLCVDDVVVPYSFAVLEGHVALTEGFAAFAPWMEQMVRRYRTDIPDAERHVRLLGEQYSPILGRMAIERSYFEPVVSPAPESESSAG